MRLSKKTRRDLRIEKNAQVLASSHIESDLGQRAIAGGFIGIASKIAQIVVQLSQAAILARLLAPEDFGLLAMAMVVTGFVGLFTELGLATATIQRKTIDQNLVSALFFINVAVGFLIMLLAWLVAPLAAWLFGDQRVAGLVVVLAMTIPLAAGWAQHKALLNRQMRWRTLHSNMVISQVAALVVSVSAALFTDAGYWALAVGMWVQHLVALILGWWVVDWRPTKVVDWNAARSALSFGANLTFFTFTNWFNRNLDNALIGWRWGAGELGFYTRAYQLLTLPIALISGPISGAVIPALSRLQDQPNRWRASFLEATTAVVFLSYAVATLLIATSDSLILLVYGDGWQLSADIFIVLLLGIYATTVANLTGWIYISLGLTRRMAIWGLIRLPISLLGFLLGLPYGAIGVAYGFVGAALFSLIPCVVFAAHETPVSWIAIIRIALLPSIISLIAAFIGRMPANGSEATGEFGAFLAAVLSGTTALFIYIVGIAVLLMFDKKTRARNSRLIALVRSRMESWLKVP